jgi:glucokinase
VTVPGTGSAVGAATFGVDIGGTKILGVVIGEHGAVLAERRVPTPPEAASSAARRASHGARDGTSGAHLADSVADAVADAVAGLLGQLARDALEAQAARGRAGDVQRRIARVTQDVVPAAVGIGIAGLVDGAGVLRFSPNLAALQGADIGALVAARLAGGRLEEAIVRTHNDASCAALAELHLGAARGMREGLVLTLGTGIGGAQITDGRVRLGAHGFGGEFGHMVVDPHGPPCPCGNRGCWERFASGGGLARLAREAALAGTLDEVVRRAGGDAEHVTAEHVTTAAGAGDPGARRVMDELGWWIGLGLANLVAAFDPQWIVLGGGLGHVGDVLLEPARTALSALVEGGSAREVVPVVEAGLGEQAGAVGAALAVARGGLDLG